MKLTRQQRKKKRTKDDERFPLLSFCNTDIAFRDDVMVAGSYHGFNVYQLGEMACRR